MFYYYYQTSAPNKYLYLTSEILGNLLPRTEAICFFLITYFQR